MTCYCIYQQQIQYFVVSFVKHGQDCVIFFFFSSGLSEAEARKLDNFLHFRQSKNKKKSALDMGDWNPAMDYLDALSDDIPKGDTTELNLS